MLKEPKSKKISFEPLMYKVFPRAELSIVEVNGIPTQSNITSVRLDKISEHGFCFVSTLRFPVNPHIILNIRVIIHNEAIDLLGTINKSQRVEDAYQFEVLFNKNQQVESKLIVNLIGLAKQYTKHRLRAEYYYNSFSEATYHFKNNQINILM